MDTKSKKKSKLTADQKKEVNELARHAVSRHQAFLNSVAVRDRRDQGMVANIAKGVHSTQIGKKGSTPSERAKASAKSGFHMHPALEEYGKCVADPFRCHGAKGLLGAGNVIPSMTSFCATTTSTINRTVVFGTTMEIGLFGGHGNIVDDAVSDATPMGPQSMHAYPQYIGGLTAADRYVIGPVVGDVNPRSACGYTYETLSVGAAVTNTGVAAAVPIPFENALPFTSTEGDSHSLRWRLVGMGVRVWNQTEEGVRGGDLKYSQPNQAFSASTQGVFSRFSPNFGITNCHNSDDGFEVSWLPRTRDIGYWHSDAAGGAATASTSTNAVGLRIWINNTTTSTQDISIQIVYHWEIAGAVLATLQSPSAAAVHSDTSISTALLRVRSVSNTAHGMYKALKHTVGQAVGAIAHDAPEPSIPRIARVAGAALKQYLQ
jgi:hypothetical protein